MKKTFHRPFSLKVVLWLSLWYLPLIPNNKSFQTYLLSSESLFNSWAALAGSFSIAFRIIGRECLFVALVRSGINDSIQVWSGSILGRIELKKEPRTDWKKICGQWMMTYSPLFNLTKHLPLNWNFGNKDIIRHWLEKIRTKCLK